MLFSESFLGKQSLVVTLEAENPVVVFNNLGVLLAVKDLVKVFERPDKIALQLVHLKETNDFALVTCHKLLESQRFHAEGVNGVL